MQVGGRERERQPAPRLVAEEADRVGHLEPLRELGQLAVSRAEADHDDLEPFQVAEKRRGADERVEILCVPDVPGVHDDERVGRRPALVPSRCAAAPDEARSVSTQFGITSIRSGARALLLEAQLHRLADRDDPVCATEVERHEPS